MDVLIDTILRKTTDFHNIEEEYPIELIRINVNEFVRQRTLLSAAVQTRKFVLTRKLVETYKANVNFGRYEIDDFKVKRVSYPLYLAAENGDLDMVQYLVENGAEVNPYHSAFPLFAASGKYADVAQYLINNGADVNFTSVGMPSCLMLACAADNFRIVKMLVENGAKINVSDYYGETCLFKALPTHNYKMFDYLIENGADVNRRNKNGKTILHTCAEFGDVQMYRYFKNHGAKNSFDPLLKSELTYSALSFDDSLNNYIRETKDDIPDQKDTNLEDFDEYVDSYDLLTAYWILNNPNQKANEILDRLHHSFDLRRNNNDSWNFSLFDLTKGNSKYISDLMPMHSCKKEVKTAIEVDRVKDAKEKLQNQALLIFERVLTEESPFFRQQLYKIATKHQVKEEYEIAYQYLFYAIDLAQKCTSPVESECSEKLIEMLQILNNWRLKASDFTDFHSSEPDSLSLKHIYDMLFVNMEEVERIEQYNLNLLGSRSLQTNIKAVFTGMIHYIDWLHPHLHKLPENCRSKVNNLIKSLSVLRLSCFNISTFLHMVCKIDYFNYKYKIDPYEPNISRLHFVGMLIKNGSPINIKDHELETPLQLLLQYHLDERNCIINVLIKLGATINIEQPVDQLMKAFVPGFDASYHETGKCDCLKILNSCSDREPEEEQPDFVRMRLLNRSQSN